MSKLTRNDFIQKWRDAQWQVMGYRSSDTDASIIIAAGAEWAAFGAAGTDIKPTKPDRP